MNKKRLSHFVSPVERHPALQDVGTVQKLLDAHAEISMRQAIHQTARRFNISEEEVVSALKGDNFYVRFR